MEKYFVSYNAKKSGSVSVGSCFIESDNPILNVEILQSIQDEIKLKQEFDSVIVLNFQKITEDKKSFFLRHSEGETFVIPSEKVQEFDVLQEQIESCEEYSDFSYELNSRFDELYGGYKMEGNLYDTKFYLDKHPNLLF